MFVKLCSAVDTVWQQTTDQQIPKKHTTRTLDNLRCKIKCFVNCAPPQKKNCCCYFHIFRWYVRISYLILKNYQSAYLRKIYAKAWKTLFRWTSVLLCHIFEWIFWTIMSTYYAIIVCLDGRCHFYTVSYLDYPWKEKP